MDLEIRPIGTHEVDAFLDALEVAFGHTHAERERQAFRAVLETDRTVERDRALAAFERSRVVGVTGAVSFHLSVPGGTVPAAGVTTVGVLPTHRRRGVLTTLMRRQLDDLRVGGEPVAALWASEGSIYGRFGYGVGTFSGSVQIDRAHTGFARPLVEAGWMQLLEKEAALHAFADVYERVRPAQPGMVDRSRAWWEYLFLDLEEEREGFGPLFFVAHESVDGLDGYAVYHVKADWARGYPGHLLEVEELVAATPAAYAALWRYCFDVDLVARIRAPRRPPLEPLFFLLADPRRLRSSVIDGLWVRLVDVPRALAARRYASEGGLMLEVQDHFCPWNEGVYRLEGGPEGAECRRAEGGADLVLSAAELGTVYLAGTGFRALARAGRVTEVTPGALARADAMFAWDPPPWCPNLF